MRQEQPERELTRYEIEELKLKRRIIWGVSTFVVLMLLVILNPLVVIDETERGVVRRLGKVSNVMEPGLNFRTPFIERVYKINVGTEKIEVEGVDAASKDQQTVTTSIALQFNVLPGSVRDLYVNNLYRDYKERVIDPAIQDAVKASTAKFNASELITKRPEVKEMMESILAERLGEVGIHVSNLDVVNFEFSASFNAAIEQKVTAEQEALREKNNLEKVQFEAQQAIERAKAEAEKTRLEVEALKLGSDLIEKIYAEAQLEAAKRWNGVLPTHMYGSAPLPLLNVEQ